MNGATKPRNTIHQDVAPKNAVGSQIGKNLDG